MPQPKTKNKEDKSSNDFLKELLTNQLKNINASKRLNYNDIKMSSYFYFNLPQAANQYGKVISLSNFYVRDYTWLANYLGTWQVFTPASLGQVIYAKNNLNGTVTITFNQTHNLIKKNGAFRKIENRQILS